VSDQEKKKTAPSVAGSLGGPTAFHLHLHDPAVVLKRLEILCRKQTLDALVRMRRALTQGGKGILRGDDLPKCGWRGDSTRRHGKKSSTPVSSLLGISRKKSNRIVNCILSKAASGNINLGKPGPTLI